MRISVFSLASIRCCVSVLAIIFALIVNPVYAAAEEYQINKGDKLKIDVWQEENLLAEVMVSPDGTISFPLVGIIPVAGKTANELKSLIKERLAEYIPEPEVNVSIVSVEGNQIYIIGEVTHPGPYIMSKNLDVMQALSLAGGLTPFAAENDIHVVRHSADGQTSSLPFRYGDVEDGKGLDAIILLQSGDTVIVP